MQVTHDLVTYFSKCAQNDCLSVCPITDTFQLKLFWVPKVNNIIPKPYFEVKQMKVTHELVTYVSKCAQNDCPSVCPVTDTFQLELFWVLKVNNTIPKPYQEVKQMQVTHDLVESGTLP